MQVNASSRETYDCPPTLNDQDVIDFCKNGFLVLPGVVPDAVNQKVVDYLDDVDGGDRLGLMTENYFVDGVLKNPQAAGAVRSLLGRDFTMPEKISNHRGPLPFIPNSGGWHRDGGTIYTHQLEYLQVFYYPEAVTDDMGPTEVLPGSHFVRHKHNMMAHYGTIAGTVSTASVAGTIFLTVYGIWHRRTRATSGPRGRSKFRDLLKYNYWRTTPPVRDWIIDPSIDIGQIDFRPSGVPFEQFLGAFATAKMFCSLCGIEDQYVKRGGQCWPVGQTGMPPALQNPNG